ncbi:hypothetical protein ACHAWF_013661 [Thalassiosira exigua]
MSVSLCCPFETPIEGEARLSSSQLKTNPVHIWWHRRRIRGSLPQDNHGDQRGESAAADRSPFPKSWSANVGAKSANNDFFGSKEEVVSLSSSTDDSSVFSTQSQEQGLRQDEFGYCIKHPNIQLARKKQISTKHQLKYRFSKVFSKHHNNSFAGGESHPQEEWDLVSDGRCPECEKEHINKSKARYQYKPKTRHLRMNHEVTHVPFPATLTLIDSHPHLEEGTLALRVRTDPLPTVELQSMHLSCSPTTRNEGRGWKWNTPDGVFDFSIPADISGEISLSSSNALEQGKNGSEYEIMERIIPLSSIDHVSRGGDAWDVLRQSTGEGDFGCNCDVKIHGWSDRLLRFDVVTFGSGPVRSFRPSHSFGGVDLCTKFSVAPSTLSGGNGTKTDDGNCNGGYTSNSNTYTTDYVISAINSIVMWDREKRERGMANLIESFRAWLEEHLSLGVSRVDTSEDFNASNNK